MILLGLSASFNAKKTDKCVRYMVDKDGLWIYRSMIGTSLLESMRQNLTKLFGNTMDGVLYSNCLMNLLRHHMNQKASERNRTDFPQACNYNGFLIDYVNDIYESIFGFTKYVNWELSTKYMLENLPYGIVPLDKEGP